MIKRTLGAALRRAARNFPVVSLTGPRQSGKTTLARAEFRDHEYVSLEAPDRRAFALEDPRGFLASLSGPAVLDEVQRAPDLFSYIQGVVDERKRPGQFILTGSYNFLLMQSVSQSLAGRCAVLHLLPFSLAELHGRPPLSVKALLAGRAPAAAKPPGATLMETMFTGFYPRIHDQKIPPRDWLASYNQTYLERDVRNVLNVGDLETFGRFVRLLAGRSGQLLNLTGLAADAGVTHTTAKRWLSVLQASFIVALVRPHHQNLGKRLIKSPKLYFLDPGLLCYLLQIQEPGQLVSHPLRGAVFESFVAAELHKNFLHRGEQAPIYFFRDAAGHEVDVILDLGADLLPLEIKSAQTVAADFFDGIKYWRGLRGGVSGPGVLVYGGDKAYTRSGIAVCPWFAL